MAQAPEAFAFVEWRRR
uniref:Uncharacterized protein n=1 Tax=Arundo donax TaxID=35708 RepID=A0A0A9A340_ARUDO